MIWNNKQALGKYLKYMDNWCTPETAATMIPTLQKQIYVMIGGGLLGKLAVLQPDDFYIDKRAGGLPYSRQDINGMVRVLSKMVKMTGINPPEFNDNEFIGI